MRLSSLRVPRAAPFALHYDMLLSLANLAVTGPWFLGMKTEMRDEAWDPDMKLQVSTTRLYPLVRWTAVGLALVCAGAMAQQTADVEMLETAAQRGEVRALVTLASK